MNFEHEALARYQFANSISTALEVGIMFYFINKLERS